MLIVVDKALRYHAVLFEAGFPRHEDAVDETADNR